MHHHPRAVHHAHVPLHRARAVRLGTGSSQPPPRRAAAAATAAGAAATDAAAAAADAAAAAAGAAAAAAAAALEPEQPRVAKAARAVAASLRRW